MPFSRHHPTTILLYSQSRSFNFFAEFYKSIKRQVQESKEMQENIKQLSDKTTEIAESDIMKRAKSGLEKGGEVGGKAAGKVQEAAQKVMDTMDQFAESEVAKKTTKVVKDVSGAVAEGASKVAEPILDTAPVKAVASGVTFVKQELEDTASTARYVEYRPKAERDAEREARALRMASRNPNSVRRMITANPDAGAGVVMHKSSRLAESWKNFKETNPIALKAFDISKRIEESDNPILDRMRSFMDGFSRVFEETEEAKVVKALQMYDPGFRMDQFMKDVQEWMIPDIMEAYLKEDAATLKEWCSEGVI